MSNKNQTVDRLKPIAERLIPVATVSFHGDKCYQIRGEQKPYAGSYDPSDLLLSINTSKTMDAPAGTFTITLAGDSWFKNDNAEDIGLKPNDLVVISMGYKAKNKTVKLPNGTTMTATDDLDTVMVGLIDTVTRNKNSGGFNGMPTIQTTVTGRDFGKILLKAMLKFYPQIGAANSDKFFLTSNGWITLLKDFTNDNSIKGSPAKVIDTILRYVLGPIVNIKWSVYNVNTYAPGVEPGYTQADLGNVMQYILAQTNFFVPFFMTANQYEGSIWNMMNKVNIKPFTELFVDTRDRWEVWNNEGVPQLVNETVEEMSSADKANLDAGSWAKPAIMFGEKDGAQVALVYRNTPFSDDAWSKLRNHDIDPVDVIQETLSYSDNENYNLFWAGSTLAPINGVDLKAECPPLINEDNVTRYGLNPLEVSVEGLEIDPAADQLTVLEGLSNDLNTKLQTWFQDNVTYLSGPLTLKGKGSIKIGQKATYGNREYYIESVNQDWQLYSTWQTKIGVTRGHLKPPPAAFNAGDTTVYTASYADTTSTVSTATIASNYYTVVEGDTLWGIASYFLGDGNRWTEIWDLNKDMLIDRDSRNADDPGHWIYPGQSLLIPS